MARFENQDDRQWTMTTERAETRSATIVALDRREHQSTVVAQPEASPLFASLRRRRISIYLDFLSSAATTTTTKASPKHHVISMDVYFTMVGFTTAVARIVCG
jgi:hypothetical protein